MKKIYLIIAVLICQQMFCQQVLVPYRVKDKWGLSDVNGKMVVNADYDYISAEGNLAHGYFGFRKGNAKGVIYNKKEIISGSFTEFLVLKNKLIIAEKADNPGSVTFKTNDEYEEYRKKRGARYIFNLSGKNLQPEGFKYVKAFDSLGKSSKYKASARYLLFLSENFEGQKSVLVYDVDKQDIADQPLKDHYKLNLETKGEFPNRDVTLKGRQTIGGEEMVYTFKVIDNKVKMESSPANKPSRLGAEEYGTGSGSGGYGDGDITIDSYSGNSDAMVEAPYNDGSKTYDTELKVNGSTITLKSTEYPRKMNSAEGIVEKIIPLPYEVEWVKEERLYSTFKSNGNMVNVKSVASFKTKNGKYGIVFLDTLIIKPEYEYLVPFTSYSTYHDRLNFIAGKKDAKTGNIKYGTVDIHEKAVIPIIYDSIFFDKNRNDKNFVQSIGARRWNVLKDGKYGCVDIDGKIILEPVYDSIYQSKGNYLGFTNSSFTILKKNGKFGLYNELSKYKSLLIEPVFIRLPGYYIEDYQGQKGLMLFGLTDDEGHPFCYARPDGFLYYKE